MHEASETEDGLKALRTRYPEVTFLALGQTALWDEPTKATLLHRLRTAWPEARFVAGVHDTDYFAKLPGHPASAVDSPYALVRHDDWTTRGLWSAAGEMHQLFGSEDVPTRAELTTKGGVSLHRTGEFVDDPDGLLADLTRAFGWTGLIRTGWKKLIVAEVKLAQILPVLLEQVEWACCRSAESIEGAGSECTVGALLREWIVAFAQAHPDATLPELYQDLLPRLHGLLLGETPELTTTRTTELLRLNPETAALPRFAFLDLFLNPATRRDAEAAYDLAVAGSDVYTLERFGDGALPFEVAVPGHGRGTLHVLPDRVIIDAPQPLELEGTVGSVAELAARLTERFGPRCTLLGKAITLLPMLAAEFVFVFHEGASSYSDRTRLLLEKLAGRGVTLPALHPILRVRYWTWDALCAVDGVVLNLPEHLRQALGRPKIAANDLAACWRRGVEWERQRLADLAALRSPRALVQHFSRTLDGPWSAACARQEEASATLLAQWERAAALRDQADERTEKMRALRAEMAAVDQARGEDFRARDGVLDEAAVRERTERFDETFRALRRRVRALRAEVQLLKAERKAIERGETVVAARETLRRLEADAERERARQAANALRTVHGLPHASFRPSAWWFPTVDPSGAWFRRVADSAELYLEPLTA